VITTFSLLLFFYVQAITEESLRRNLLDQQKHDQITSTYTISNRMQGDLNSVLLMVDGLANSIYLQKGDVGNEKAKYLVEQKYTQFAPVINRLLVLDRNGRVSMSYAPSGIETFLGQDFSSRSWVDETRSKLQPLFSNGFELAGIYRIFITYPIINRDDGQYIGLIAISLPTVPFFSKYLSEVTQQLIVYDDNGTILTSSMNNSLVGQSFFSNYAQDFFNHNKILMNLTEALLIGKTISAKYDYGTGEILTTQSPLLIHAKFRYFVQISSPTKEIISQLRDALYSERLKMITLLGGSLAAIAILTVYLIKWNSTLQKQVRIKSQELLEAERIRRNLEESVEGIKHYLEEVKKELYEKKYSDDRVSVNHQVSDIRNIEANICCLPR
jgi:hypothetical protein